MAVERVGEGEAAPAVIASYGFNRTTIYKWLAAAAKPGVGLGALKSQPAPGRSRSLTPRQERQVLHWINGKDPRQYGLDFGLWTRSVVAELIERKFDIRLGLTAIGELLADNALYRLRAAQGVIGLADKHDPGRLEAACAKAIAAGDPSYRTVRGILAAGAERDQLPAAAGDGGAAAFLRGPASFANVIPMPGTIPSDAVTPVTAEGAPS